MKQTNNPAVRLTAMKVPYVGNLQFWDYQQTFSVSSSAITALLMDPLLISTGLMPQYPQNCKGYWNGTTYRLRGRITVKRVELRLYFTGAQSTVLAAGDLFNFVRVAFYKVGAAYSDATEQYLGPSYAYGTDIDDVSKVYLDKTYCLSSTAFDSANGYNVPATRQDALAMDCDIPFDVYSTTSSGTGSNWNTVRDCFKMDLTSDSTVSPHPVASVSMRFYFTLR